MNDSHFYHLFMETPIGEIALLYMDGPFSLVTILLPSEKKKTSCLGHPAGATGRSHPIRQIETLLKNYFKGRPIDPPWEIMSLDALTSLQKAVLNKTAEVPFGGLRSYRDIAMAIGRPGAYRFVGTTLGKNPYPILIPCHRIIRSDKGMGGFGGGIELKKRLIDFESYHR
jgi:methylated-DNA-[protein]-cysteine S-methyltransferase